MNRFIRMQIITFNNIKKISNSNWHFDLKAEIVQLIIDKFKYEMHLHRGQQSNQSSDQNNNMTNVGAYSTVDPQANAVTDSFTQKSQNLRKQMQIMNDKLFETDRMLSMQSLYRQNGQNNLNAIEITPAQSKYAKNGNDLAANPSGNKEQLFAKPRDIFMSHDHIVKTNKFQKLSFGDNSKIRAPNQEPDPMRDNLNQNQVQRMNDQMLQINDACHRATSTQELVEQKPEQQLLPEKSSQIQRTRKVPKKSMLSKSNSPIQRKEVQNFSNLQIRSKNDQVCISKPLQKQTDEQKDGDGQMFQIKSPKINFTEPNQQQCYKNQYHDRARSNVSGTLASDPERASATQIMHDISTDANQSHNRYVASVRDGPLSNENLRSSFQNSKNQTRITEKNEVAHAIDQLKNKGKMVFNNTLMSQFQFQYINEQQPSQSSLGPMTQGQLTQEIINHLSQSNQTQQQTPSHLEPRNIQYKSNLLSDQSVQKQSTHAKDVMIQFLNNPGGAASSAVIYPPYHAIIPENSIEASIPSNSRNCSAFIEDSIAQMSKPSKENAKSSQEIEKMSQYNHEQTGQLTYTSKNAKTNSDHGANTSAGAIETQDKAINPVQAQTSQQNEDSNIIKPQSPNRVTNAQKVPLVNSNCQQQFLIVSHSQKNINLRFNNNSSNTHSRPDRGSSSLQTTNNNSRKSMLLDHKRMDQQSSENISSQQFIPRDQKQQSSRTFQNQQSNSERAASGQHRALKGQQEPATAAVVQGQRHLGPDGLIQFRLLHGTTTKGKHYAGTNTATISSRNGGREMQSSGKSMNQKNQGACSSQQNQMRPASCQNQQLPGRSSRSNLTNNGKSEPICSDMETQRQTVISNLQQFNQEITNGLNQINSATRPETSVRLGQDLPSKIKLFDADKNNINHRQLHQQTEAECEDNPASDQNAVVEHNFFDPYKQFEAMNIQKLHQFGNSDAKSNPRMPYQNKQAFTNALMESQIGNVVNSRTNDQFQIHLQLNKESNQSGLSSEIQEQQNQLANQQMLPANMRASSEQLNQNSHSNQRDVNDYKAAIGHEPKQSSIFQNDRNFNEKAFENTRSHEALFQSSKGCTQLFDNAQYMGENFFTNQDMLKHIDNNGSFSYNRQSFHQNACEANIQGQNAQQTECARLAIENQETTTKQLGQLHQIDGTKDKVVRKIKRKKSAITQVQSPKTTLHSQSQLIPAFHMPTGAMVASHEQHQAIQLTEIPSQDGDLNLDYSEQQHIGHSNTNNDQDMVNSSSQLALRREDETINQEPASDDQQFLNIAKKINEASGSFQSQIPYFNMPHSLPKQNENQTKSTTHVFHSQNVLHAAAHNRYGDRKPMEKLSRSISQFQPSKIIDDSNQNMFLMNKRQSHKSIKSANAQQNVKNQILGSQNGGSNGQQSRLGSQSRSIKKNHEQIMEQIKLQNERNLSQKSMLSDKISKNSFNIYRQTQNNQDNNYSLSAVRSSNQFININSKLVNDDVMRTSSSLVQSNGRGSMPTQWQQNAANSNVAQTQLQENFHNLLSSVQNFQQSTTPADSHSTIPYPQYVQNQLKLSEQERQQNHRFVTADDGTLGEHRDTSLDRLPSGSIQNQQNSRGNLRTSQDLPLIRRGHNTQTATVHRSKDVHRLRSSSICQFKEGPEDEADQNSHEDSQTLETKDRPLQMVRQSANGQHSKQAQETADNKQSTNTLSLLPQMLPDQIHACNGIMSVVRQSQPNNKANLHDLDLPISSSAGQAQSRQMTQTNQYLCSQQQPQIMNATLHKQENTIIPTNSQQTQVNLQKLLSRQDDGTMEIPLEFMHPMASITNYNTQNVGNLNMLNAMNQNLFQTQQAGPLSNNQQLQTVQRQAHASLHAGSLSGGNDSVGKVGAGSIRRDVQNALHSNKDLHKMQCIRLSDPKNLRNFFIQSSLTFNGNNLNSQGQNSVIHQGTYGTYVTNEYECEAPFIDEKLNSNALHFKQPVFDISNQEIDFSRGVNQAAHASYHGLNESELTNAQNQYGYQQNEIEIWDGNEQTDARLTANEVQSDNQQATDGRTYNQEGQQYLQEQQRPVDYDCNQQASSNMPIAGSVPQPNANSNQPNMTIFHPSQNQSSFNQTNTANQSYHKHFQPTNQHSRSNSQTLNENSQSQLTQSNSKSYRGQSNNQHPNLGHANTMSQKIGQSQSSHQQQFLTRDNNTLHTILNNAAGNVSNFIGVDLSQIYPGYRSTFDNNTASQKEPGESYALLESCANQIGQQLIENASPQVALQEIRQREMSISHLSNQQPVDRSTRAVTHSNSQKRGSQNGDEPDGQIIPLRQSATTESFLQNHQANDFLSHQPSGCHDHDLIGKCASNGKGEDAHSTCMSNNLVAMESALHPDTIFDLPSALIHIQGLKAQIQNLEGELEDARREHSQVLRSYDEFKEQSALLAKRDVAQVQKAKQQDGEYEQLEQRQQEIEQQILDIVKEDVVNNQKIAQPNDQNNMSTVRDLKTKINLLQDIIKKKVLHIEVQQTKIQDLQAQNEGFKQQIEMIKADYLSKLLDKQREIDAFKVQEAEKEKWLQQQYQHIQMLSGQVECAWNMIDGKLQMQHKLYNQMSQADVQEREGQQYSQSSEVESPEYEADQMVNIQSTNQIQNTNQLYSNSITDEGDARSQTHSVQMASAHPINQQSTQQDQNTSPVQQSQNEVDGSFGKAEQTSHKQSQTENAQVNQQANNEVKDAPALTPSEGYDEQYLKNIPEIDDNLSNKVVNLNQSSQKFSNESSRSIQQVENEHIQRSQQKSIQPSPNKNNDSKYLQTSVPQINMHLNMSPVASEVEKLRHMISHLTEQMINIMKVQEKQNEGLQRGPDARDQNEAQYQQINLIKELRKIFQRQQDAQTNQKQSQQNNTTMVDQCRQLIETQTINGELKIENARLKQSITDLIKQISILERRITDLKSKCKFNQTQVDQSNILNQSQQLCKSLEKELLKERINCYQMEIDHKNKLHEMSSKYDRQLRDMRSCLGFVFGKVQMQKQDVPKWLQEKIISKDHSLHDKIASKELINTLKIFDYKLQDIIEASNQSACQKENASIRRQLADEQIQRRQLLNQLQDVKGNVRVLCRIRPQLRQERNKKLKPVDFHFIGNNMLKFKSLLSGQTREYQYDRIFRYQSKQTEIYDELQNLIQSSIQGYNVCIMTYGQTGSGKTYTMVGDDNNPGLYFSAVDEIFNQVKQKGKQENEITIHVSVVEVYNERIRDLLPKEQKENEIKLLENIDGDVCSNQMKKKVTSRNQVLKALRDACYNRTVGVTQFNEYSSRSHFIMTLYISSYNKQSRQRVTGKLNLVDLAGSERILRTNAEGLRVKEAQNINKSLTTLSKVFIQLKNNSTHIPYRDSKLTHYLKDSLGQINAKTLIILQLSPLEKDQQESLSTLSFGQQAQFIQKAAFKNQQSKGMRSSKHRSKDRSARFGRSVDKPSRSFSYISIRNRSGTSLGNIDRRCASYSQNQKGFLISKVAKNSQLRPRSNDSKCFDNKRMFSNSLFKISRPKGRQNMKNKQAHHLNNTLIKSKSKSKQVNQRSTSRKSTNKKQKLNSKLNFQTFDQSSNRPNRKLSNNSKTLVSRNNHNKLNNKLNTNRQNSKTRRTNQTDLIQKSRSDKAIGLFTLNENNVQPKLREEEQSLTLDATRGCINIDSNMRKYQTQLQSLRQTRQNQQHQPLRIKQRAGGYGDKPHQPNQENCSDSVLSDLDSSTRFGYKINQTNSKVSASYINDQPKQFRLRGILNERVDADSKMRIEDLHQPNISQDPHSKHDNEFQDRMDKSKQQDNSYRSETQLGNSAGSRENKNTNAFKYRTQLNSEYRAGIRQVVRSDVQDSHSQNIYSGLDASNCTSQNLSCNFNQSQHEGSHLDAENYINGSNINVLMRNQEQTIKKAANKCVSALSSIQQTQMKYISDVQTRLRTTRDEQRHAKNSSSTDFQRLRQNQQIDQFNQQPNLDGFETEHREDATNKREKYFDVAKTSTSAALTAFSAARSSAPNLTTDEGTTNDCLGRDTSCFSQVKMTNFKEQLPNHSYKESTNTSRVAGLAGQCELGMHQHQNNDVLASCNQTLHQIEDYLAKQRLSKAKLQNYSLRQQAMPDEYRAGHIKRISDNQENVTLNDQIFTTNLKEKHGLASNRKMGAESEAPQVFLSNFNQTVGMFNETDGIAGSKGSTIADGKSFKML